MKTLFVKFVEGTFEVLHSWILTNKVSAKKFSSIGAVFSLEQRDNSI